MDFDRQAGCPSCYPTTIVKMLKVEFVNEVGLLTRQSRYHFVVRTYCESVCSCFNGDLTDVCISRDSEDRFMWHPVYSLYC